MKREISIAAWLHDCGKVVTPEYVVDKATKLETIYNRIHEIRTRFEVIHRDLTIEALNKKLNGENAEEVDKWLTKEHQKLQEEFEFIAKTNVGSEFMSDEDIEKIKIIAQREWIRHFDDKIGLSRGELENLPAQKFEEVLPIKEKLLNDKLEHIIPRDENELKDFEKYNFKVEIPKNLYNRGEIYNLSIKN
jgi:hypothetical protein